MEVGPATLAQGPGNGMQSSSLSILQTVEGRVVVKLSGGVGAKTFIGGGAGVSIIERRGGELLPRDDALVGVVAVPLSLPSIIDIDLFRRGGDVDGASPEAMKWQSPSACSSLVGEFPSSSSSLIGSGELREEGVFQSGVTVYDGQSKKCRTNIRRWWPGLEQFWRNWVMGLPMVGIQGAKRYLLLMLRD